MLKRIAKIESYGFECIAGPLELCVDWLELKDDVKNLLAEKERLSALAARHLADQELLVARQDVGWSRKTRVQRHTPHRTMEGMADGDFPSPPQPTPAAPLDGRATAGHRLLPENKGVHQAPYRRTNTRIQGTRHDEESSHSAENQAAEEFLMELYCAQRL